MRLRTIDRVEVKNKKVLVRVDFNVAIEDGAIKDDFRIVRVVPSLRQLLKKKAKVIVMTHLGRPQEAHAKERRARFSLRKVAQKFEKDLGCKVHFVSECVGARAQKAVVALRSGEILMLENVRFHPEEEQNDAVFASRLAALADVYVNEAFSVSHRAHASVSAITRFLPSYAGTEFAREMRVLHRAYARPKTPLLVIMGGAKVETKARLLKRFFEKADNILLGGIVANAVLQISGIAIGKSKFNLVTGQTLKEINVTSTKLHLPVDVVVAKEISESAWVRTVAVGSVKEDEIILDIGPDTVKLFSEVIASAGTIIWNGPLGYSELQLFAAGTRELAKVVAASKAFTVVGGGESVAALDKLGLSPSIDFISTGGGAMLEFLAGDALPGIEALKNKRHLTGNI